MGWTYEDNFRVGNVVVKLKLNEKATPPKVFIVVKSFNEEITLSGSVPSVLVKLNNILGGLAWAWDVVNFYTKLSDGRVYEREEKRLEQLMRFILNHYCEEVEEEEK